MALAEFGQVRRYISDATANSHAAIKNCWLVMFTAGTYVALSTTNTMFRCHGFLADPPTNACSIFRLPAYIYIAAAAGYFLTFARFYIGDIRIFDRRYSEIFRLVNDDIDSKARSGAETQEIETAMRRFDRLLSFSDQGVYKLEVLWLLMQTLIVVFVALQIDSIGNYLIVYATLLILNSIWLVTMNRLTEPVFDQILVEILPQAAELAPSASRRIASNWWVKNNLVHAACITVVMVAYSAHHVSEIMMASLGLFLCLSNCAFDFVGSLEFYFPKFWKFYSRSQEP